MRLAPAFPARRGGLASLVAAAVALLGSEALAQVDEVQLRLLTQFELPLRWDNVEPRGPYWEKGVKPTWRKGRRYHALRLEPGQSTTVRLPPGESLRLHALEGKLPAGSLSVSLSNGTGLQVGQPPRSTANGQDWLVEAVGMDVRLARVSLAADSREGVDVALFVSRREPLGTIAPYRYPMPLPGRPVVLRPAIEAAGMDYWQLSPGSVADIEINGPIRYALASRLAYPPEEASIAQGWRIEAGLDGRPWANLEFETAAENTYPVLVDGKETVVTREKEGYLEIPPGRHRLTLKASAPLFARLLAQKDPDYLVPSLNELRVPARTVRAEINREDQVHLRLSGWGESGARAAAVLADPASSPTAVHAAAQRLLQDNRMRETSIMAAAASQQTASRRRDEPALRIEANEEFQLHTYYRDLLPREKAHPGGQRFAWYLIPRLHDIGETGRGTVAAGQHESELLGWMDSGLFLPLEAGTAYGYDLPKRFSPTYLRVAVHGGEEDRLFIQFDDEAPRPLTIAEFPELAGKRFVPSTSEAALRLQEERHAPYGVGTLSGAFSRRHTPAPLIPAGVMELPLPSQVRQVKLWRQKTGEADGTPLWAALKLRIAKPYQLSERAYLEAARRLDRGPADEVGALPEFLAALGEAPALEVDPPRRETDNHWQPLARLVRAQGKLFNVTVAAAPPPTPAAPRVGAAIAEARRLEERGQWLPAFEAWSVAAGSPDPKEREEAQRGRIGALRQLGEEFLAEQLLKQEMLQSADTETRRRAREALADIYRQAADQDGLQATYAAALLRDPDLDTAPVVSNLAAALLDNGEAKLALTAGLLLPRRQRPLEILLRAAYAAEWWAVFDDLVAQLLDEERRHFWLAQKALTQGRRDEALTRFRQGGEEGRAFATHMEEARSLFPALDPPVQPKALTDWSRWLSTHPGPRTWRDAGFLATDFAGAQSVYAIDRDAYFNAFRTVPGRPLRLRLAGPAHLRIEARPIHPAGSSERTDGWLHIRAGDRQWHAPITQNAATTGLELVGRALESPGRRVVQELELGPGWHEVEADGGDLPLLMRVQSEEPEILLPLLPRLTPETATARPIGISAKFAEAYRPWLGGCPECSLLLNVRPGEPPRYERLGRELLAANPTRLVEKPALLDWPVERAPATDEASLRAKGDWRRLLSWPTDQSEKGLRERMTSLVWIGEHQPNQYPAAVALAEALRAAFPKVSGLAPLAERLTRNSTWTPVEQVNASAGLRSREIPGWEPEAPTLRVRRSLLAPTGPNERVLAGENRLVIALTNTRPTSLSLTLASADVAALPPQPLVAMLQIDEGAPKAIRLEPGRDQARRSIPIPAGRHSLRLWIDKPLADQFLRVTMAEAGRPQFAEAVERFYHVATPQEPVRLKVPGPAWVRVDEWVAGRNESRYLWVKKDWQEVVLKPQEGQREALYRIHLRTAAAGKPVSQPRTLNPEPTPVPDPPVTIPERVLAEPARLEDRLPLGGQEDGTWSLGAAWRERLYGRDSSPVPEGLSATDIPREKFLELSATHRYFDQERNTYFRTDLLARQRNRGGPTFGALGLAALNPRWSTWNLVVDGSLYAQDPGSQGSPAWSWSLRATALQQRNITPTLGHLPRLSLFARDSSLSSSPLYRTGELDQDIFTPYRAQHRYGFQAGDTVTWRPWLDTEFYAGASLVTNEDFNPFQPDHGSANVGWRQLLGPFQVQTQWGGNHYFADDQRNKASNQSAISLDLTWEHWLPRQERLESGLTLRREVDAGTNLVGFYVNWHFGNGRAYRDFRPAETDFRDLRQRQVPPAPNNRFTD